MYVKVRHYHFEAFRMLIYGVENSQHSVTLLPIDKSIINTHRASLSYHYMTDNSTKSRFATSLRRARPKTDIVSGFHLPRH